MGANWLNLGEMLRVNAKKFPAKMCLADSARRHTFAETNARVNRLANAMTALGLVRGDRVACFLENSIEICELYMAAAKTGIIVVPMNFRIDPKTAAYVTDNSDAKMLVVHDEWVPMFDELAADTPKVAHRVVVGKECIGWTNYDAFIQEASDDEPDIRVLPEDIWIQLYTSGTTGVPKGVVRSHESYIAFYLINAADFKFDLQEVCLNVMPLCHVNSTFFTFAVTYMGGSVYIHPARSFRPLEILEVIQRERITFISLIPTHYNLILNAPEEESRKYDVSSIRKLLCSSAPVFKETKLAIMDFFKGVDLYEGYGSTEAGIVTTLMPWEQMTNLGSIGRESSGTDVIRILDEEGNPVPAGQVGEIYSRGPMMFSEYYKMPEKTGSSFRGEYFSAGDMGRMDEEGYYYIVDRKDNMIITGGEHVYPSEVEAVICSHRGVFDAAVIGLPHDKWGEQVTAVVIPKDGVELTPDDIVAHCADNLAAYKKPKDVKIISQDDMPRTGTGKILHRILRERYSD